MPRAGVLGQMMKRVWAVGLMAAIVAGALATTAPLATAQAASEKDRVFGATRVETSVEISRVSFPETSPVVYLARSDIFADALAAGSLTDGPVLLVPSCGDVPPVVRERVAELDPERVTALGGTGAVCDAVLDHVAGSRPSGRIEGGTRYDTAVALSQRAFPDGSEIVYVASGADTAPDAVAGGILTDGPILLLPPGDAGSVPSSVLAEITRLDPEYVYALGGPVAVSRDRLKEAAGPIRDRRIAGGTRYETAVKIADRQFPADVPQLTAYLAQGEVFADAVAAGSLTDGPILLVPQCGDVPAEVLEYLREARPARVVALGGQNAICDPLLEAASQFTSNVDFIRLDVDGPELLLDATKPYVLVTDAPMGQVSLVYHDYSRGFAGRVSVETYDQNNERIFRSALRDSDATNTIIDDSPGRYITRLTPDGVEAGAEIRAVATKFADPGLRRDVGNVRHTPDRFGSGLDIPFSVSSPSRFQWASGTAVDNIIDVYSGRGDLQLIYPDGQRTDTESLRTDRDVSLRWPSHETGLYRFIVDPRENRIRSTVSADTWVTGSTSLASPPFNFRPDRVGDGGTWRYSANLRHWHSIVGFEDPEIHGRCVFEIALIDRSNEQVEEQGCNRHGVAAIAVETPYSGDFAALAHSLKTAPIRVEVTPWARRTTTIDPDGAGATVSADGLRGRGGVIAFDGDISREIFIQVDYPDAQQRPDIKLERPSGVFLDPRDTDRSGDTWLGEFELPEDGTYRVLVDTKGYPTDFAVKVTTAP